MGFISCSGLAGSGIEASAVLTPFSNRRGVRSVFLLMFQAQFLWPRASKLSPQTPQCKVLLDLLLWLWRSWSVAHACPGRHLRGSSPQVEACKSCTRCSGTTSNERKILDTMTIGDIFPPHVFPTWLRRS